jgi:N-acetylglutamate synthase-like GNAT family acetyltransferase
MIRRCRDADFDTIYAIINDAASAYRGVIPAAVWHEPYMSAADLTGEIASDVEFWGFQRGGDLVGVMGAQLVADVTLIRHAYVRGTDQRSGVGAQLLESLCSRTRTPILIGTWAAAWWAIRFYEKYGFTQVSPADKDRLLRKYWTVPPRQIESSVVLANTTVDTLGT